MMRSLLRVSRNWQVVAAWFLFLTATGGLVGTTIDWGDDEMCTSLLSVMYSFSDMSSTDGVIIMMVAGAVGEFRWRLWRLFGCLHVVCLVSFRGDVEQRNDLNGTR